MPKAIDPNAPKTFLAGATVWVKPENWGQFNLADAHTAMLAARETFYNAVKSSFPNVPPGRTLEVFPGVHGSFGVKLASPETARSAKAGPQIAELAALFGADKKRK